MQLKSEDGRQYEDSIYPHSSFDVPTEFDVPSHLRNSDIVELEKRYKDCFTFMRWLMDEVSHIGRMEKPVPKSRIINVLAKDDEYIPHYAGALADIWNGRYL